MSKITLLLCHLSPLHSSSCQSHVPACKTFAISSPFLMGKLHQRLLLPITIANSDCFDQSHHLQSLLHVKLSKIKVKGVLLLKLTWWFRGAGATRSTCLRKMRIWLPAGFAPCCSSPLCVCVLLQTSLFHIQPLSFHFYLLLSSLLSHYLQLEESSIHLWFYCLTAEGEIVMGWLNIKRGLLHFLPSKDT